MSPAARTATLMAFRDQRRRPLVLVLLVLVPAYVILWSVAETKPTPRAIELDGDVWVRTTMKALHGPGMAGLMVAFLAALLGVFVMRSALAGDRRLVVAGFPARDELTMKKASVPERNAADQPALIAAADCVASVPPSAFENSPSTPAKISTKNTGIAISSTIVSGARSCSRTNRPLVSANALTPAPPVPREAHTRDPGARAR